jgi:hypothetical protein
MRWPSRSVVLVAGIVALVALGSGHTAGLGRQMRVSPASPLVRAADDHVAFVAVVDTRRSPTAVDLVGYLELVLVLTAGCLWWASIRGRVLAPDRDPRRRWRARLVGAPPTFA